MAATNLDTTPLVVIAGPTASGKTALAIRLAERYDGEIICADSRTIYKGMDIGTAKPTTSERARIPHWGLDLVEPGERYSAADFKQYAVQKINEIRGEYVSITDFIVEASKIAKQKNIEFDLINTVPVFKLFGEYENKDLKIIFNESSKQGIILIK